MRLLSFLFLFLVSPVVLQAQSGQNTPAVLVADQVFITRDRTLVAQGNVEAFQGETRLRAGAIRYSQSNGSLVIEGPIVIQDGEETVILADAAQLDDDMRSGILTGARLILNQRLQLAANQINRVDGRYSQLYKTAVTSCKVCGDDHAPLWQIRAKRVVHDKVEKQLYFDEAQFRIRDVPVFYLPRMRLPDPTQNRATGFLIPSVRTTSQLGTGIKVPYFIKLGDHKDLTLTPYLSSSTKTLELRYRQAFAAGRIEFNTAVTRDDQRPDETRGYFFGTGSFDLRRDYKLYFDIETTGDRTYLTQYGYSDKDRLKSELTVSRARRDEYVRASLINFESLRDGEDNDIQPTLVLSGLYEKRFFPDRIGGELRFSLEAHNHRRWSNVDTDANGDGVVDGRDVARINGQIEWLRRMTFRTGLVADFKAGLNFDLFDITQDSTYSQNHSALSAQGAVALRYPMIRKGNNGVVQMIEPVAQVAWTGGDYMIIPNEESTRVEFDEGNLLSLSRFPAADRRERGIAATLGFNWARINPTGWDARLAMGQVFRSQEDYSFTTSSGLREIESNILLAAQIKSNNGLSITGRGIFDSDFDFTKAELRGDWDFKRGSLGGSYVWLETDLDEDRAQAISEITLDGSYQINNQWTANADWRYDLADERAATAGLGLTYNNECVSVDLLVNRRYSTSTSVEPSTNIGFNIGLRGFAASTGTERYERSCRN